MTQTTTTDCQHREDEEHTECSRCFQCREGLDDLERCSDCRPGRHPLPCGCYHEECEDPAECFDYGAHCVLCPTHEAAPEMLEALRITADALLLAAAAAADSADAVTFRVHAATARALIERIEKGPTS